MDEVTFGAYGLPVVLMLLLGLFYKFVPAVPDRWKSAFALVAGVALGFLGIAYSGVDWTVVNIVDYGLYGLMQGAAATGLYEVTKSVSKNPRG